MTNREPETRLDDRFSSENAAATEWGVGRAVLEKAELYWLTTVRADGRPHVTPLLAVWMDGAMHFTTGPTEQKARNLIGNPQVVLTTGRNVQEGLDVIVEGVAVRLNDEERLRRLSDAVVDKYGPEWRFTVRDGTFHHEGGEAWVFEVEPVTAFGFGKGEVFSQTRWRFNGAG
ncbi:pyridoxamine 5'-phosphate oxidase family protein [Thermomonospora umbrina]|uniref:Nitroimidazol reductase NimA-like FMN-containing flavoprotein (Pyridoxamine 5'-phosphate oxidase superfamily) n=1 Tax=Thermomonospora umbrina TaxID=111806 RepID=A0A3D9T0D9_9ACTN|nr:pyridoxamine 5'-phosphate oxidase family protein [Thermomonospora umbrina]REE97291.1 nitroimidazol reductase NimA-like FMN-containing flavoprotein (pyridoxamine 5'-phosphate oxidase superfamily) [Thermomonospora umbrina]